ncbi:MAG TPA: hypothetical protein VGA70_03430 [Longimicrobiales bacterium]|jgi:hypothetical protein
MSETPRPPKGPRDNIDSEHARILAEVMDDQAKKQAARTTTTPVARSASETSFFVQVALLASGTFFFYLLFFSPAWVTPTAAEPIAQETVDQGLRTAIFLSAQQVEGFRQDSGRLPDNTREAGVTLSGVEYTRLDAQTFQLIATRGADSLTYQSTEPLIEFLGDALGVLAGGSSQ